MVVEPYVCSIKLGEWQKEFDDNRRRELAPSPDEMVIDSFTGVYVDTLRRRRAIARVLRPHALSFAMWLVLYATHRAVREAGDGVSQEAICRRTSLGKASVSRLMNALCRLQLIDVTREEANRYWVWATDRGVDMLEATSPKLANVLGRGDGPTFDLHQI